MLRRFLTAAASVCAVLTTGTLAGTAHHPARKIPIENLVVATQPVALPAEAKADPQIERLLRELSGTWSITEEFAPATGSPKGKTGQGTIIWRPGPGGYSAVEEYRSKQGDEEISGLGEFWWDEAAHGYHTIWCDSTNPTGCIDFKNVARWEKSDLVLQEDYEVKGRRYTFKEVFGNITDDSFTQTLYGGDAGGSLKVDQVIHGKRVKVSPSR